MAYESVKNQIDAYIKANGVNLITGPALNAVLTTMLDELGEGYAFQGVIYATDTPSPAADIPQAWLASAGTYLGGSITVDEGELALIIHTVDGWSKETVYRGVQLSHDAIVDALGYTPVDDADLAGKQDTIADLSAIRSGAALGSTSVQPVALENMVEAEPIGSIIPPVNPSEFATKEEVSQLQQEIDGLAEATATGSGWTFVSLSTAIPKGAVITGALLNGVAYTSGSLFFKDGNGNQYNVQQNLLPYTAPDELETVTLGQTGAITIQYQVPGINQKIEKNETDIASVSVVATTANNGVKALNDTFYGDKVDFNKQGGYNNQSILLDYQLEAGKTYYIVVKPNTLFNNGSNIGQLYVNSPRELIVSALICGMTSAFSVASNTAGDLLLFLGRGNMKDTSGTLHDITVEIFTDAGLLAKKALPYFGEKIQFRNRFDASILGQLSSSLSGTIQGSTYYGGYFFVCHIGLGMDVVDKESFSVVDTISALGVATDHGNNLSFGVEKYSDGDYFPLLYVSGAIEVGSPANCYVFRIQKNGTTFSATKVQEIIAPASEDGVIPYFGCFCVDAERKRLYMSGYKLNTYSYLERNPLIVLCWELPEFSDGATVTLRKEDIIESFSIPSYRYAQGYFINDGRMYQVFGSNEGIIVVTDLYSHTIVSEVNLTDTINYVSEPEALSLIDDSIYMIDTGFRIYKFDF